MITKKQFKTTIIALLALYVLIFAARFAYDLITYEDPGVSVNYYYAGYNNELKMYSNVASARKEYAGTAAGSIEVLEQKYEQVATITTKTASFDDDLAKLDTAIEQAQAVIQTEAAQGLVGNRTVTRVIGVKPQYFDSCLEAVKEVGMLITSTSQKTDKTYEYRQMLAQKQELEKRLESYISLREHSGSVNEMISLEDKIIEVESMLLRQAVDLGEYSDDNALCTINVSLYEGNPASAARIIWNSFTWATICYLCILGGLVLLCIVAVILIKTYTFLRKVLTSDNKRKLIKYEAEKEKVEATMQNENNDETSP
jgi:hypothetical protein